MAIIDKVRKSSDIVKEARRYTKLRKRGNRYIGLCPLHSEKEPSFTIDPEKQLFHCFGCGQGGDIFTLIMEKEKMTFPEALKYLAKKNKIDMPDTITEKPKSGQKYRIPQRLARRIQDLDNWLCANPFRKIFNEWMTDQISEKRFIHELDSLIDKLIRYRHDGPKAFLTEELGLSIYDGKDEWTEEEDDWDDDLPF